MTDPVPSKDLSELYQWLIDKANDSDPYDAQMFTKAVTIVGERLAPETAPTAWMRGHRSYSPGEPDDYDVECVYGDDPPDDSGKWIPLYRRPAPEPKSDRCNALWLGCQLPPGHDGNHRCGAAVWSTSQPPVTPPCAIPFAGNSKGVNYEALANATYPERMYGDDEPEGEDRIKCPTCGQGHVDAAARTLRARLAQPPREGQ